LDTVSSFESVQMICKRLAHHAANAPWTRPISSFVHVHIHDSEL
jgi:hypothetical protein